jgi:hypothetical protein
MLKFLFYVCMYVMYDVYFLISSFLFYSLWWMYTIFSVLLFSSNSHVSWKVCCELCGFAMLFIVPCSVKIFFVDFLSFSFLYFLLILLWLVGYLANHCTATLGVNRLSVLYHFILISLTNFHYNCKAKLPSL